MTRSLTDSAAATTGLTGTRDTATVDVDDIYRTQWHSMVRLAVLLVNDPPSAEDAVQDAFVALHRHRHQLRDPEAAVAYVRTAVVNRCRSTLRRRIVARRHLATVGIDPAAAMDDPTPQLDDDVMSALRTLPRRTREVLVLRYWAGLTEAQIATTLEISIGTVKSTASRGLSRLRETLGDAQ